jgi:hypothetical protein
MPSSVAAGPAAAPAKRKLSIAGLSLNGLLLFITGLFVLGSGFANLRPEVMGLRFHPYLIPVGLALPFVLMARLGDFPVRILASLTAFLGMYTFAVFNGRSFDFGELFKVATSVITIIVTALLVRKRGDVVAGALGLAIAIAALAVTSLEEPTAEGGVAAMEGGNKNSYSLYALPAILLAGYIALRMPTIPIAIRSVLIACALPSLVAIFMSGNRSGYLGALLIGLMLFRDRRLKGLLLVAAVAGGVAFWIVEYGSTKVLDEKLKQTVEGYGGDVVRKKILYACLEIGMDNPVIGVSPQQLPFEIGRRVTGEFDVQYLDPHNAFAHLFAACGVLSLLALFAVGWSMCFWKPRNGVKIGGNEDPLRDAVRLMRMMVILWAVRGFFTRDILYNPSFSIGLGLAIGLCMLAEVAREQMMLPAGKQKSGPRLAPAPALAARPIPPRNG